MFRTSLIPMGIALAVQSAAIMSIAQDNIKPSLDISADTRNIVVSNGDPIVASVTIRNITNEPIDIGSAWIRSLPVQSIIVTRDDGTLLDDVRDYSEPVQTTTGRGFQIPIVLRPEQKVTRRLVLNRVKHFTNPGRYHVLLAIRLEFRPEVPAGSTALNYAYAERQIGLNVNVGPTNIAKSHRTAEELLQRLETKHRPDEDSLVDVESLFSMPDYVATKYWRLVALDNNRFGHIRGWVIANMKRLGTRTTIGILGEMWNGLAGPESAQYGRDALAYLYNHGNPAIKPDIGRLFTEREGAAPPKESRIKIEINPG